MTPTPQTKGFIGIDITDAATAWGCGTANH